MTPNMPWIEAHEALLAATKRSRLSAAATAQAMRRARLPSFPADPYAWYMSCGGASSRRASSPTGFDSVYDSYAAVESDHYLFIKARAISTRTSLNIQSGRDPPTQDSDLRRLRSLEQHLFGGFDMPPPCEPISRSKEKNFLPSPLSVRPYRVADESLASSSASSLDPGSPGSGGGGGGGAQDLVVSPGSPPRSRRSNAQLECFSRKIFVGGLPPDINEGGSPFKYNSFSRNDFRFVSSSSLVEIHAAFCRFGIFRLKVNE